jgi:hypothetical protein
MNGLVSAIHAAHRAVAAHGRTALFADNNAQVVDLDFM